MSDPTQQPAGPGARDEPPTGSGPKTRRERIAETEDTGEGIGRFIAYETVAAIVIAVVFTLGAMLFNDYLLPPPDVSGTWRFTSHTDTSTKQVYVGMRLTYKVFLAQHGDTLTGIAEKVSEQVVSAETAPDYGPVNEYTPGSSARALFKVTGHITHKYFSRDELVIQLEKQMPPGSMSTRGASELQLAFHLGDDAMSGTFYATDGSRKGQVAWARDLDWDGSKDGTPIPLP